MWLPDRRTLLLMPVLAACGFSPAGAPDGPVAALQGTVRVADPADRNAFDLVERLEERLGRPVAPRFDLAYTITTDAIGVGLTPEAEITRYNLTGRIDWTVTDRTTQARVAGGTVQDFTSYAAVGSTVAALAAEEDAGTRLMRAMGDQIVTQLIAADL
jgi:LPS-assembly lipoprotein